MAETSLKQIEVMGWAEESETYQQGYDFGVSLQEKGKDGLWAGAYVASSNVNGVEREILDPANRELLQDKDALKEAANRTLETVHPPERELDERLRQIGQNIGDRNWALTLADTDFTKYLNLSKKEKEIITPSSANVTDIKDAAAYLATYGSGVVGMMHAFTDRGNEARLIGWEVNSLSSRLHNLFSEADAALWTSLVCLNEPAEQCLAATDKINESGFVVSRLLKYRELEARLVEIGSVSTASDVAFTGAHADKYDADADRLKTRMANYGFKLASTTAPGTSHEQYSQAVINADTIITRTEPSDTKYRTRVGGVAYLLATDRYDFGGNLWYETYRPEVLRATSEAAAEKAWGDFMRIQHEGYTEKALYEPGVGKKQVTEDYQQRMRKWCATVVPSVMALGEASKA